MEGEGAVDAVVILDLKEQVGVLLPPDPVGVGYVVYVELEDGCPLLSSLWDLLIFWYLFVDCVVLQPWSLQFWPSIFFVLTSYFLILTQVLVGFRVGYIFLIFLFDQKCTISFLIGIMLANSFNFHPS